MSWDTWVSPGERLGVLVQQRHPGTTVPPGAVVAHTVGLPLQVPSQVTVAMESQWLIS